MSGSGDYPSPFEIETRRDDQDEGMERETGLYQDENGRLLFEVVRLEKEKEDGKTPEPRARRYFAVVASLALWLAPIGVGSRLPDAGARTPFPGPIATCHIAQIGRIETRESFLAELEGLLFLFGP
jgi:hypothetical protein